MKERHCLLFTGLVMVVLFMGTSILHAGDIKFKKKPTISSSSMTIVQAPDLVITKAAWSKSIKEGDVVGRASILNITVLNRGNIPAGANKLRIECKSLTGTNYPYPLNGMIDVQPLGPGKSANYAWPPMSSEKWFSGKYRMTFTVDYLFNKVKESNETNNTRSLVFTVSAKIVKIGAKKIDIAGKIKKKPKNQFHLNTDLEIVSISMIPVNPVAGKYVKIYAKVRNSGTVKTHSTKTRNEFRDTTPGANYSGNTFEDHSPNIPSLIPGETFDVHIYTEFIMFGAHASVTVTIDPDNRLAETNETNNTKTHYFSVQCKPEISFYHHMTANQSKTMNAEVQTGKVCQISFSFYNNGWCQSKAGKISVTGDGIAPVIMDLPKIHPCNVAGGEQGYQLSLKWDTPGVKHCIIKLDSTNTNDESIESNNEMELIVNVVSTWPNPE